MVFWFYDQLYFLCFSFGGQINAQSIFICVIPVAPGPPTNVQITFINSTSVKVLWDKPTENNGAILGYNVYYFCANANRCSEKQHTTTEQNLLVTGLHPYTEYVFVVYARTVVGWGQDSKPVKNRTLEVGKKSLKC